MGFNEDEVIETILEISFKLEDNFAKQYVFHVKRIMSEQSTKKYIKEKVQELKGRRIKLVYVDKQHSNISLLLNAICQL
jgi:hypothetical protein